MDLGALGLSKNESMIYLFLLKRGSSTTGPVIKGTGIANSRVYESINALISKGLVTYTVQKNGKHFAAVHPKQLLEIEEERRRKVTALIPELAKLQLQESAETTVAVYEGFDGFKTAFRRIIDDCPARGTIDIIGFSEQPYAFASLRTFLKNMNLRCVQKKQKLRVILDESTRRTIGKDREREPVSEVRYMPKGFVSPAAMDIFGDYVYIFLWEEKPFVFMVKNKRIAESFRQYFSFLWKMARP